jgi:diguanylate cyclase (GGDEF)-like protein
MESQINIKEMTLTQRKSYIEQKVLGYDDWQITIDKKIEEGIISKEEGRRMISRALAARDIRYESAEYKNKIDELTGLFNRKGFNGEFNKLTKEKSNFALLIVDLDNFKKINHEYGYLAGNNVIIQMGANFLGNLRQARESEEDNDFICRWGGDEFVILLKNIDTKEKLQLITDKFRKINSERAFSVTLNGINFNIPAEFSMGASIYNGGDKNDFFNKVNEGLKQAKTTGKNKSIIVD